MEENEVLDRIDHAQELDAERDKTIAVPLTKRVIKEYQKRLSLMSKCQRATQDNRLKLISEFSCRCHINFCDASLLIHGKDVDVIMEKYNKDTSEARDIRSTQEIF